MKKHLKNKRKMFAWGSSAVCLLLVIILVSAILAGAGEKGYAIYMKDQELFHVTSSELKPWKITEQFVSQDSTNNQKMAEMSYLLNLYVKLSEDAKKIFYIGQMDGSGGMTLYYRTVNGKDKPQKIAGGIQSFEVNDKGNLITYLKSPNGQLYQYNLKDEEKIAADVESFFVSENGKTIFYKNKSGDVYRKRAGEERTKIATNVKTLIQVYDSGELYYLKDEVKTTKLIDFVTDDMKKQDEKTKKPEFLQCPFMWEYETKEEYEKAYAEYDKKYEGYKKQQDAYEAKVRRDSLRKELEEETIEISEHTLCYYNGKKEIVVSEHATGWKTYAKEKEALIYSAHDYEKIKKLNISELTVAYQTKEMLEDAINSSYGYYLTVGVKSSEIKQEKALDFDIDATGKTIYMIDHVSEKQEGELYKIKVSNKKAGKPKKVDEEVYLYNASYQGDLYVYYKDVHQDGNAGDLYVNGKCIDFNVRIGTVNCKTDSLAYMTEWNEEGKCGILRTYEGRKASTVYKEVSNYVFLPNGEIAYLRDYSQKQYKGNLYIYKGKKSQKADEDVVALIRVNTNK